MEDHRILCLSTRPDNAHLWQNYADESRGCCLEFVNSGPLCGTAHHVIYGDELVLDFVSDEGFDARVLFRKTKRYAPEEEVRIMQLPRGGPHVVAFDPVFLNRIILGRNMTSEHRQMIWDWCRVRTPNLAVVDAPNDESAR